MTVPKPYATAYVSLFWDSSYWTHPSYVSWDSILGRITRPMTKSTKHKITPKRHAMLIRSYWDRLAAFREALDAKANPIVIGAKLQMVVKAYKRLQD
jgi:hypothetical protein